MLKLISSKRIINPYEYFKKTKGDKTYRLVRVPSFKRTYWIIDQKGKERKAYPVDPEKFGRIDPKEAEALEWLDNGIPKIDMDADVFGIEGVNAEIGASMKEADIGIKELQRSLTDLTKKSDESKALMKHKGMRFEATPFYTKLQDLKEQYLTGMFTIEPLLTRREKDLYTSEFYGRAKALERKKKIDLNILEDMQGLLDDVKKIVTERKALKGMFSS